MDELGQGHLGLRGEFLHHRPGMVIEGISMLDQHSDGRGSWRRRDIVLLVA